jgi:hypothetical protein
MAHTDTKHNSALHLKCTNPRLLAPPMSSTISSVSLNAAVSNPMLPPGVLPEWGMEGWCQRERERERERKERERGA